MMRKVIMLLVAIAATAIGEAQLSLRDNCPDKCGEVEIPYPFGVGEHCSLNPYFNLTCYHSNSTLYYSNIQVLNISLRSHQMDISMYVSNICYSKSGVVIDYSRASLTITAFPISSSQNKFYSVGCDSYAYLNSFQQERNYSTGCLSRCNQLPTTVEKNGSNTGDGDETCSGIGCCQVDIPPGMRNITFQSYSFNNHRDVWSFNNCSYSFVAKEGFFNFSPSYLGGLPINMSTLVLDWSIVDEATFQDPTSLSQPKSLCSSNSSSQDSPSGFGYRCFCNDGFQGNPYIPGGCQDVNECLAADNDCDTKEHALCNNFEGGYHCSCPRGYKGNGYVNGTRCTRDSPYRSLIIAISVCGALLFGFTLVSTLCWAHKQRTLKQIRERNFEQNGGNMLLQTLSQQGYADRTKIFAQVELQNATNNFDEDKILGRGGQGTVYKGILPDNTVVAIKKSRVGGDPRQIKDFINEVVVLSQINHRNVVKLLGCCLETEVPLLVYEFVDNGTLLYHIDPSSKNECSISWETRLRIATETAEAISYLHSAASIPIIHRDIKSTNILLDHNHRAKVSDFGASRLVPLDETQVTTVVQGTLGYLDPEYLHTGQLNEKSDVYSFGVVLIELLTGNKAVECNRPEQRNLAMYFVSSIKEDRLWDIIDKRLLDQKKNAEQLKEVAFIARRCVRVSGEERPTMKEVAMELEGLIAMETHPWLKGGNAMAEETEYLLVHVPDEHGGASTSNSSGYDTIQKQIAFEIADGR